MSQKLKKEGICLLNVFFPKNISVQNVFFSRFLFVESVHRLPFCCSIHLKTIQLLTIQLPAGKISKRSKDFKSCTSKKFSWSADNLFNMESFKTCKTKI